jgi:hypothetical protein
MFGTLPASGFYCRHVDGLTLRDIDVRFARDDRRPAVVCDDVRNLRIEGLTAQAAAGAEPAFVFRDVHRAMIGGCTAAAGLTTFLRVEGGASQISVIGNDLSGVATPFQLPPTLPSDALYQAANAGSK